jgi:uncharacterized protein (TIGR03083 family)
VSGMAPILASRCGRMAPGTVPPTVCPALLPVVTNYRNILFDILVHGQDIALPLGLRRDMPVEAARAGATRVWTMGWPFWANRRLRGFRLTATDTTWTSGKGADIRGPIDAMLLLLTGRPAALPRLAGDGVPELTARLSTFHRAGKADQKGAG